jgi:cell division septation protein DedD
MADEGLREIQLNGKQLVFLFMASTVVAVVIFLCGVMVGRGVRAETVHDLADAPEAVIADPTISDPAVSKPQSISAPPIVATSGSSTSTPSGAGETLTYSERLGGAEPPDELKEPLSPVPDRQAYVDAPAPSRSVKSSRDASRDTRASKEQPPANPKEGVGATNEFPEPGGVGFVVQVAAVKSRAEAYTIARRLAGKGYPSFVTVPGKGSPTMFRVRVGKFKDRKEVDSVAGRLQKEEQFRPWITR